MLVAVDTQTSTAPQRQTTIPAPPEIPFRCCTRCLIDYRGEDAHERFRFANLKMVQENVQRIEIDIAEGDGDEVNVRTANSTTFRMRPRPTFRLCLGAERTNREFGTLSDVGSNLIVFLRMRGLSLRRRLPPSAWMRPGWSFTC